MADDASRVYLAFVEARLAADGCAPRWHDWGGAPVLIGRRADFRVRWMATRLHLFTVAAAVPEITPAVIETFTRHALQYAKDTKGGLPLGFQTGVAVFPVLCSALVHPHAMAWAQEKQRTQFACCARPVVVDLTHRHIGVYRGTPALGWIYAPHLRRKTDLYFSPPG